MFDRTKWRSDQPGPWVMGPPALPHNGWHGAGQEVQVGGIIVHDRRPYRVLEITERPEDLWPERYEQVWQKLVADWQEYEDLRLAGVPHPWGAEREAKPPLVRAQWPMRPVVLVLQVVDRPESKPRHVGYPLAVEWQILPEHYSVCRVCAELPPCRHQETENLVEKEMAGAERLMAIPRGACLGCGKTITHRMKKVQFPGPNLWRPDWGNDSAVFHGRDQGSGYDCTNGSWRYETQWKAEGLDALNPQLPEGQR